MKFRPIGERTLVKPVEREEKTASGIVLPETARDQPQMAEVVAIGDSQNGGASEGNLVIFTRYSGTKIKLDDEEYLILDSDDLLGIIEEE